MKNITVYRYRYEGVRAIICRMCKRLVLIDKFPQDATYMKLVSDGVIYFQKIIEDTKITPDAYQRLREKALRLEREWQADTARKRTQVILRARREKGCKQLERVR